MKKLTCIIGSLALLASAASCSLKEQEPTAATVSTSKAGIEVDADAAFSADPFSSETPGVTDTLEITSTRSWTVSIKTEDGNAWVKPSVKEHINAGDVLETSKLALNFSRYKGSTARKAILTIYCTDLNKSVEIPIVQKAYVPKLSVEAVGNPADIPAEGGECWVVVRSNTNWKADISKLESTVIPNISLVEGDDTQAIRLDFPANSNDELAKFAKLVVSSASCEPASLELVQSQSERFFFLSEPVAKEVIPYEDKVFIPLRSNGPWSATLSECTFENGRVEPSEGMLAYSGIYFNYSMHGEDPLVGNKHALVTISREGMEDIKVEFTQKGSIHLNFGHFNPDYEWEDTGSSEEEFSYKPYTTVTKVFSEPASFPYSYTTGTYGGVQTECITSAGGFSFKMHGSDCGLYYTPGSYCFCIGKKQGDYVIFPSFEGYRLSELYYEASCRNMTPYTIRDAQGNVIEGGELTKTTQTIPISKEYNDMHHHIFPGTKAGENYRMVLEETLRVISIKDLCLVYEKYE